VKNVNTIIVIVILLAVTGCENELPVNPTYQDTFIKYFGMGGDQTDELGVDLVATTDGFVLLGETISNRGKRSIYVVKTNLLGNDIWQQKYDAEFNVSPSSLAIAPDGNMIIGATAEDSTGNKDVLMLLLDSQGNMIDSALYKNAQYDEEVSEVIVAEDGGFAVLGTTTEVISPKKTGILVLRTYPQSLDTLPRTQWTRIHDGGTTNTGVGIVQSGNVFYCLATSDSKNGQTPDRKLTNFQFFSLDMFGEPIADNGFQGSTDNERSSNVIKTEGGFVLLGNTLTASGSGIYVVRLSQNMVVINEFRLNGINITGNSIVDIGSGYVILGYKEELTGDRNIYLVNTDKFGNIVKERTYGSIAEKDEGGKGIAVLENGHIVFVATVDMGSQTKMALFKTDPAGDLY